MTTTDHVRNATMLRAKDFYNAELREKLESTEKGKYVVIDSNSLDYEVDASLIVAAVHLKDRQPDAWTVSFEIGYESKWATRPRRDTSRTETSARDVNDPLGKKVAPPAISRSPASLDAEAFYNAELRAKLETEEKGKFIIIDPESSDYEVDSDPIVAVVHLKDRQPNAEAFMFRIGYDGYVLNGRPFRIMG